MLPTSAGVEPATSWSPVGRSWCDAMINSQWLERTISMVPKMFEPLTFDCILYYSLLLLETFWLKFPFTAQTISLLINDGSTDLPGSPLNMLLFSDCSYKVRITWFVLPSYKVRVSAILNVYFEDKGLYTVDRSCVVLYMSYTWVTNVLHAIFVWLVKETSLRKCWSYLVINFGGFCLFVLRFYGPVNPMGSRRARSVYLTTRLLGRLSPLSG